MDHVERAARAMAVIAARGAEDWTEFAQAVRDADREAGFVLVRADLVEFLRGAGPLDGYWFGDRVDGRAFWWRKYLPALPE